MADTTYTYDVATDCPAGAVNTANIEAAIAASSIVTGIRRIDTAGGAITNGRLVGGTLAIVFKDALSIGDKTILDGDAAGPAGGLIASTSNAETPSETQPVSLTILDPSNPPSIAADFPPVQAQAHYVSHNLCDPSTWYQKALRVEAAATTVDGGDAKVFHPTAAIATTIINATSGKINQEDVDPLVLDHIFRVYDNGVEKKIAGPGADTYPTVTNWADYGYEVQVDYGTGAVSFKDTATGPVTIDYSCLNASLSPSEQSVFAMVPPPGYKLRILKAETQFSKGVEIKDTTLFSGFAPLTYAGVQVDNTLDPGLSPESGIRYRIDDASSLHANFGTIKYTSAGKRVTLGDGDVVEFDPLRGWGILFDASAAGSAKARNITTGDFDDWSGSAWSTGAPGYLTIVEAWGVRKSYKSLQDFLNEATGNYPIVPAGMVIGARGCAVDILQIPWNWVGSKSLKSSEYAEVRIFLENGIAFIGDYVTATFYCQLFKE